MEDLLRLMNQTTLSPEVHESRPSDQITYETGVPWSSSNPYHSGSHHLDEPSAKERAIRETFERNFFECLQRPSICRKELELSPLSHVQSYADVVTQLRPVRRFARKLARALREDDCCNNPYLKWSRQDILSALRNRHVPVPDAESLSRFECRLALEHADKTSSFRFLELPKDIRMLVYEQALLHQGVIKQDMKAPPALLQVNRQVRQESRETFYSINHFRLRIRRWTTIPQDDAVKAHTARFHPRDLQWLLMIGSENVARLRRLSFITRTSMVPGDEGVQVNLSDPDASKWARPAKCSCRTCQNEMPRTIAQQIAEFTEARESGQTLYTRLVEHNIRIRDAAQSFVDGFGERYGKGKCVRPTVEGLERLADCIMQNFGPTRVDM